MSNSDIKKKIALIQKQLGIKKPRKKRTKRYTNSKSKGSGVFEDIFKYIKTEIDSAGPYTKSIEDQIKEREQAEEWNKMMERANKKNYEDFINKTINIDDILDGFKKNKYLDDIFKKIK